MSGLLRISRHAADRDNQRHVNVLDCCRRLEDRAARYGWERIEDGEYMEGNGILVVRDGVVVTVKETGQQGRKYQSVSDRW